MLRFGVSGIPRTSLRPSTESGVARVRALGLDVLEMAWVNGVRMSPATADRIAAAARAEDVALTAHAPYYVNLFGDAAIRRRSIQRLLDTGRLAARCGAQSFCFHAGFYPARGVARAVARAGAEIRAVVARLADEGVRVDVRPELTGRRSQLGTLDEILDWCAEAPGLAPCVDFAHLYARSLGDANSYDAFAEVLDRIQRRLGRPALERLHVHLTGIEYGPNGERRHVPLATSRFRWRDVLRALRDRGVSEWVIGESPIQEDDARRLARAYRRLG